MGLVVALFEGRHAQERKQDVIRLGVLRVHLEDRTLEILDGVAFAIDFACLLELVGDRITLLGQSAVGVPIVQELPPRLFSGGGERTSRSFERDLSTVQRPVLPSRSAKAPELNLVLKRIVPFS